MKQAKKDILNIVKTGVIGGMGSSILGEVGSSTDDAYAKSFVASSQSGIGKIGKYQSTVGSLSGAGMLLRQTKKLGKK